MRMCEERPCRVSGKTGPECSEWLVSDDKEFREEGEEGRKRREWKSQSIDDEENVSLDKLLEQREAARRVAAGSAPAGAADKAVEVKTEPLTDADRAELDIQAFMKHPETGAKFLQDYMIQSRMMLAQAQKDEITSVLAQRLETNINTCTKINTAVAKLIGKDPKEMNREAIRQLMKRIGTVGAAFTEHQNWAVKFGLDVPGLEGVKRRRRQKKTVEDAS